MLIHSHLIVICIRSPDSCWCTALYCTVLLTATLVYLATQTEQLCPWWINYKIISLALLPPVPVCSAFVGKLTCFNKLKGSSHTFQWQYSPSLNIYLNANVTSASWRFLSLLTTFMDLSYCQFTVCKCDKLWVVWSFSTGSVQMS